MPGSLHSPWRCVGRALVLIGASAVQLALAAPTTASQIAASTQNTSADPSSTSSSTSSISSPSDRDSSFEILADGTQDLAALVGLFATNSVEAYTVDYSKGFLSTCVATLSLLGLLGWTKTMVKLGIGRERCERAGFSTTTLRPFYGVSEADRIPESKVFTVKYVQRDEKDGDVTWKRLYELEHTTDSMLLVKAAAQAERDRQAGKKAGPSISRWQLTKGSFLTTTSGVAVMAASFALCNFLTCFAILLFRGAESSWTWSTYFSTFGLFITLDIGCWVWLYVYVRQHLPSRSRKAELASEESFIDGPHSVAYTTIGDNYHCMWYNPITEAQHQVIRVVSVLVAGCAVVGYICQYIEVRQTDSLQSGYWLAVQGALAAIRIMIWVHDPVIDDMEMKCTTYSTRSFGELHQALSFFSKETEETFRYPSWTAPVYRLNPAATKETIRSSFKLANSMLGEPSGPGVRDILMDSDTRTWDMPAAVFRTWLKIFIPDIDPGSITHLECFTMRVILSPQHVLSVLPAIAIMWRFGAATLALRRALSLVAADSKLPKVLLFATLLPRTKRHSDAVISVPITETWPNLLVTDDPYVFTWSISLDGIRSYWDRLGSPDAIAKAEDVLGMVPLREPVAVPAPASPRNQFFPQPSPSLASRRLFATLFAAQPEEDAGGDHAEISIAAPGVEQDLLRHAPTEDSVAAANANASPGLSRRATASLRRASRRASLPIASGTLPARTFNAIFSSRLAAPELTKELKSSGRAVVDRAEMQVVAHAALRELWTALGSHLAWPSEFATAVREMARAEAEQKDRRFKSGALSSAAGTPITASVEASWTAESTGCGRERGDVHDVKNDGLDTGSSEEHLPELQEEAALARVEEVRERKRRDRDSTLWLQTPARRAATWDSLGDEA